MARLAIIPVPANIDASDFHTGHRRNWLIHCRVPVLFSIKWTYVLHAMGDNELSAGYGWEYDPVLAKKFDDHFTAIAKFAWFNSEGDDYTANAKDDSLPDASRFSVELNYVF